MATNPIGSSSSSNSSQGTGSADPLKGLDLDHFLKLMITELQNQDPLNPLDNAQMLQQISQIREIGSTDKLTRTLDAVLLGQNLTSASGLIGKEIRGLGDDLKPVSGTVDRVSVAGGVPKLHVQNSTVTLSNVSEILPTDL